VKSVPQLEPPPNVTSAATLEKLRASGDMLASAVRALTPERARYCITFPFGPLSLYQVAEFATRHVERHTNQLPDSRA
jgi:hypothetical protein